MKQFIEFIPVALFVGVYFTTKDIYLSTGVLMAGMLLQVAYEYFTSGYGREENVGYFCDSHDFWRRHATVSQRGFHPMETYDSQLAIRDHTLGQSGPCKD